MMTPAVLGTRLAGDPEDIEAFAWWIDGLAARYREASGELAAALLDVHDVWEDQNWFLTDRKIRQIIVEVDRRAEALGRLAEIFHTCARALLSAMGQFAEADRVATGVLKTISGGYLQPDWNGIVDRDQIRPPSGAVTTEIREQWRDFLRQDTAWAQAVAHASGGIDAIVAAAMTALDEEKTSWQQSFLETSEISADALARLYEVKEKLLRGMDAAPSAIERAGLVARVLDRGGKLFLVGAVAYKIVGEGEPIPKVMVSTVAGVASGAAVGALLGAFVAGPVGLLVVGGLAMVASILASEGADRLYDEVVPKPAPVQVRRDLAKLGVR